jgi:arylsulfatase A-like enzyme
MTIDLPDNVVLLTLDCVRADHLGCYGYLGTETPHLNALANQGVLFEQAVTHAPNTWVAHASIFTGCNPYRHGLRSPYQRLGRNVQTLAERLAHRGKRTAGFPGNTLVGRATELDRGFQYFDEDRFDSIVRVQNIAWRRNWVATLERARQWIIQTREPFFLWLHYIDTHHLPEIDLPEYYRQNYSPDHQYYDGKISYMDEVCVGACKNILDSEGLTDRTLIVILADHGEELTGTDVPIHDNSLRDEVIKIPLIFIWPGLPSSRRRITEQTRGIDVLPTVLDIMGILPESPNRLFDGISLFPKMREIGLQKSHETHAYIENLPKGLKAVRTDEWKLIVQTSQEGNQDTFAGKKELYNVKTDPGERKDLSHERPAILSHMIAKLGEFLNQEKERDRAGLEMNEEERKRIELALRGLGYLD